MGKKISLKAKFKEASYVAIVDGALEFEDTLKKQALVETKACRRSRHSPQVEMQEVAEMVAWIKEEGDPSNR
jgi:hypothetical protein